MTAKSGGIWFSEGDETLVSPTQSLNSVSARVRGSDGDLSAQAPLSYLGHLTQPRVR